MIVWVKADGNLNAEKPTFSAHFQLYRQVKQASTKFGINTERFHHVFVEK